MYCAWTGPIFFNSERFTNFINLNNSEIIENSSLNNINLTQIKEETSNTVNINNN